MRRNVYVRYLVIFAVIGVAAGTIGFLARLNTVGCHSDGLSEASFMAMCDTARYGDFEHGAYAFALRPAAIAALQQASVLFLGDSRMQNAFSNDDTRRYFAARKQAHYLLGFGYAEESAFPAFLIRRHKLSARAVVINVDPFFTGELSAVAREAVMSPASSERKYRIKALWQKVQQVVCASFLSDSSFVCGRNRTIFRDDRDGHWRMSGFDFSRPTAIERETLGALDQEKFEEYLRVAKTFVSALGTPPACVILTGIPSSIKAPDLVAPLARALGARVVQPELDGLSTFDQSHLTPDSARRWSAAFLQAAQPIIDSCHKA